MTKIEVTINHDPRMAKTNIPFCVSKPIAPRTNGVVKAPKLQPKTANEVA